MNLSHYISEYMLSMYSSFLSLKMLQNEEQVSPMLEGGLSVLGKHLFAGTFLVYLQWGRLSHMQLTWWVVEEKGM